MDCTKRLYILPRPYLPKVGSYFFTNWTIFGSKVLLFWAQHIISKTMLSLVPDCFPGLEKWPKTHKIFHGLRPLTQSRDFAPPRSHTTTESAALRAAALAEQLNDFTILEGKAEATFLKFLSVGELIRCLYVSENTIISSLFTQLKRS